MDIITPVFYPVFYTCITCWYRSTKYRLHIKAFRKSLKNLSAEREILVDVSNDVKRRVDKEKWELHRVPTDEVSDWCKRVEDICNEVDAILKIGEKTAQKSCLGGHCPIISRSRYELAKGADDMKASVKKLLDIGRGFKDVEVTFKPSESSSAVDPQHPTVGMDVNFHKVRMWVEDENVRSIGLFGVGGVGKTTLLKRLYNHFLTVNPKDNHLQLLWVVVSQPVNIEQIQKKLWKQLNFSDEDWKTFDKEERPIKMQKFLREKNFLLFLDDLWESIDLAKVGIPHAQPNSKLIFSTRSEEVCSYMQACTTVEANRRMEVECLAPEDALGLFRQKLGEETWTANPQIPKFAETVVKECQYLPLAVTTVAKAMVFKREPRQWMEAVKVLRSNMAKFQGMQTEVLKILKFSFDALPDERHKKCFMYCSLFPEDFEMAKYDLMDLWIGEGYFDECDNIHHARYCCEDVLDKLTTTCLLEEKPFDRTADIGKGFGLAYYKMHDLVREMALWVAREQYERKLLVLKVKETIGLHEFKDAEMISMMQQGARIQDILPTPLPYCLNLSTLILRHVETDMKTFPSGFFSSMPSLKVLDLSFNKWLSELGGDIGELTNLQYLNIQGTSITELPEAFKKLVNLKYLFLSDGLDMDDVPEEILSSIISSLRVLDCMGKSGKLPKLLKGIDVENSEVSVGLSSASELKQLLTSPGLQSCLRYLFLDLDFEDLVSITFPKSSVKRMKHFELLVLNYCRNLEEISICSRKGKEMEENETEEEEEERGVESLILGFPIQDDCFHNLRRVVLGECNKLLHLTSLIYHAPNLDTLYVVFCQSMTEVVRMGDVPESQAVNIFSCLRLLYLERLPSLKSICGSPLPFPSLRWMACTRCDLLRKLPFRADGTQSRYNKLQKIEGEEEWWNRLEWEGDFATKQLLAPKFLRR